MTKGEILLCTGLGGMAMVLIISVIVVVVLYNSRKRLHRELDREYYDKISQKENKN